MNTNDLRVVKTKQALHGALVELLKVKPLESISISELCRLAKVNRGTFYFHYEQKEALFEEYFEELMKDLEDSYYEPYRHAPVLHTGSIDPTTIRIFHHISKHKEFYKIVFSKKASLAYYYLFFEKIKGLLEANFVHYEKDDAIDVPLFVAYQANAIAGMIMQWSADGFTHSAEYMNGQLVLFLKALMEGGAKLLQNPLE